MYFQGGGACWNWVSCSGLFDSSVEPNELDEYGGGIFDMENPRNPFRDFATLFVPYCTGDVHVGDTTVVYGAEDGRPIHHFGARNVHEALGVLDERSSEFTDVVVAGTSAGSYGAIAHTPLISNRFPKARVVSIGDSGVPLLSNSQRILKEWGAPFPTLESAYREAAGESRVHSIAMITSDRDAVQSAFYLVSGSHEWREATYSLLDDMESRHPKVITFVAGGSTHGFLNRNAFYDYSVGDTTLASWISGVLAGEPRSSVRCADCRR